MPGLLDKIGSGIGGIIGAFTDPQRLARGFYAQSGGDLARWDAMQQEKELNKRRAEFNQQLQQMGNIPNQDLLSMMAASGIPEYETFALQQRFAPQQQVEPLSSSQVINGQVVMPGSDGGFRSVAVQDFVAPQQQGQFQFGDSSRIRDSEGNLFNVTSRRDPLTGTMSNVYAPIGAGPDQPVGAIEIVGSGGLTTQQRIDEAGLSAGVSTAAREAVERSAAMFDQLGSIDQQILLYDQAIDAINDGAGVGPIKDMMPSFRSASVNLDNIQRNLGLNVIQNTTFGALSEGELNLALSTALPTSMEGDELLKWIRDKKEAQRKLSNYLKQASIFLGTPPNTVADWLKYQEEVKPFANRNAQSNTSQPASWPAGLGPVLTPSNPVGNSPIPGLVLPPGYRLEPVE